MSVMPVQNPRSPDHPIDDIFIARWSPRAFDSATMRESELLTVLEAARWAPSGFNFQPWRFIYAMRDDAAWAGLVESLAPFNRMWAPKASALLVIATHTQCLMPGAAGPTTNITHAFDAGAAWGFLALQAYMSGWRTHAMSGFDHKVAAAAVNLPQDYELHAVIAIGKIGDPSMLPEPMLAREAPNPRRPLSETAFHGSFPTV